MMLAPSEDRPLIEGVSWMAAPDICKEMPPAKPPREEFEKHIAAASSTLRSRLSKLNSMRSLRPHGAPIAIPGIAGQAQGRRRLRRSELRDRHGLARRARGDHAGAPSSRRDQRAVEHPVSQWLATARAHCPGESSKTWRLLSLARKTPRGDGLGRRILIYPIRHRSAASRFTPESPVSQRRCLQELRASGTMEFKDSSAF
jgi:hypothetical protein